MSSEDKKDHLELLQTILNESKETRKCVDNLDKKVDLHIQKTEYELKAINELDQKQNQMLDEHIAGVNTLKDMHQAHLKDSELRFGKLEEPRKAVTLLVKTIIALGSVAAAIYAIMRVL